MERRGDPRSLTEPAYRARQPVDLERTSLLEIDGERGAPGWRHRLNEREGPRDIFLGEPHALGIRYRDHLSHAFGREPPGVRLLPDAGEGDARHGAERSHRGEEQELAPDLDTDVSAPHGFDAGGASERGQFLDMGVRAVIQRAKREAIQRVVSDHPRAG